MDSSSSVAMGRRAVVSFAQRMLRLASLLLLGAMGIAWSGQSLAQSCDFVAIGSTNEIGLPGTNVSFTIEAQTACAPTVNVSLVVNGGDGTGGATVVPPANPTLTLDTPYTFNVTLGPTPGGTGTVTATCLSGGCAGDTQVFTFRTNNDFDFTATTPVALVVNQITPATVGTNLLLNGAPTALQTRYTNAGSGALLGNQTPDAAGDTSLTQGFALAGNYVIRANVACPIAFVLEGCAAVPPIDYAVQVEPVSVNPVTPLADTAFSGVAKTLTVDYGSASLPAPDGTPMTWTITAQPPGGDGTLIGNPVAGGESDATFNATVLGNYTVVANSGCTFCAPGLQTFTITVVPAPFVMLPISGNPMNGSVGTPMQARIRLLQGATPVAGAAVRWTATPTFSPAVVNSTTVATGNALATFTPSAVGNFPAALTAEYDPDGVPANGDEVSYSFDVNVAAAAPPTLVAVTPNPATTSVGAATNFTVRLEQAGVPVNGGAIQWTATAPFAPAAAASATNAAGDASASFTASTTGSFPGAITALHDPDGIPANGDESQVVFNVNVNPATTLVATSGGGQSAFTGSAFAAPLVVLAENGGTPAPGVTILWAVSGNATLVAGGPTDAAGNASATVTAGASAGPVTVTATRQDAVAATASFSLTVTTAGTLAIVSGDGQTLVPGTASEPLAVVLRDAAGNPVPGAAISWTTSAGTLGTAATTTSATGASSNTVTADAPGAIEVTASSPLAAAPVTFALNGALAGLPGLGREALATAQALDEACPALAALPAPSPGQADLLQRCRELARSAAVDPGATALALDQLMANVALAQANAGLSAAQSQFQNLKTRIAALRSGTGGTRFGGLALNTPGGPLSLGLLATALSGEESVAEVGGDFSRWGFFGAGNIGRGEADGGAVDPAYDYDIEGLTFGVDYRWSDRWIVGGSLGLTRQDTDLPQGRGGLETSGWSVSGYTTYYQPDSWYVDGVLTWGRNDYEMLRRIQYTLPQPGGGTVSIDQEARSDSKGDLLSAAFTFGRDFNRGAWGLGPYARLLFTRLDFDAIDESLDAGDGSGLGLHINSRSVDSLASVLGGKLTYTASTDWGVLMPHLQLEWEHEFQDDPQALEARFINDPTGTAMVLEGDPLDTDYFRIGLGMSMVLTKGRSGFFYYERLVGRNGTSQYNLALGFRMEF